MTTYVHAELRRFVESRAHQLCEYCLIHERDTYLGCQVDHVISEKHGGRTEAANRAYACTFCNRAKGTDIGSLVPSTGAFTRFFNPRIDHLREHFRLRGALIEPLTPIGEVTARILAFNLAERQLEREALLQIGAYPPQEVATLLARDEI
jgi:hypothetical protein